MTSQTEILGAHCFLFRNGAAFTVPTAGTASKTSKPGPTDPVWLDLGVLDVAISSTSKEKEIWAPSPGTRQLDDVIPYQHEITYKIKKQELSNLDFELLFRTLALPNSPTAGGQFNPLEIQVASFKAWLKIQYYGIAATNLLTVDAFCAFKYDGEFAPGADPVETALIARQLYSPLNTGALL